MSHPRPLPDANLPPYSGGRKQMLAAAVVGVAGIALTLLGMAISPQKALLAYLIAYVYWLGLAIGAVTLVMSNYSAGARWNVTVRRLSETFGATLPLFIILFIPLLLGARHIWFWVAPHEPVSRELQEMLHHKRPYLNMGFFTVRALIYFVVWAIFGWVMRAWSLRQDVTGDPALTLRARWWSPVGLLLFAITFTFASFDWLMSLQPTWYSTIFGLYIYIGAFVASVALLCLVITGVRSSGSPLSAVITVDHQHNAGKLLLAFTAFWAYMAFSQYMLIWAGNLPEELQWITIRSQGVWRPVGVLILVGHFVVPFFFLLLRDVKRHRLGLWASALWLLLMEWLDLYWLIMPSLYHEGPRLHLLDVLTFLALGLLFAGALAWTLRRRALVPVNDPRLVESLAFENV